MNIKRRIIEVRTFMLRSYGWIQMPLMVSGMIAILKPYIDNYIDISLGSLVLITIIGALFFGWLERKLGIFQEEANYHTQLNPELNRRFDNIERLLGEKQ